MWNARLAMKAYLTICLAAGLLVLASQAQESTPAPATTAPDVEAPKIATTSADEQSYVALLKNQVELSGQFKLLLSLAQEHRKRAEGAAVTSQGALTVWETELAKELRDKSDVLLKQLSEATAQRQAFEQAHKNTAISLGSLNAATADSRVNQQEIEFMKRIDEKIGRVNQDLLTARQYSYDYAERMRTNTLTYEFQKAAAEFEQNARKIRQLEQEQSDLELRKLEFLALRRP
jgi:hypothetical protein